MKMRIHSRYVHFDKRNPQASAVCDQSGFRVFHKDLVAQMEYNSAGLYNTGFLVHRDFVDTPNPQNMTPYVGVDLRAVKNPRPDFAQVPFQAKKEFNVTDFPNVYIQTYQPTKDETLDDGLANLQMAATLTQVLTGTRSSILRFIMPITVATWTMSNLTGGGLPIEVQQVQSYNVFTIPNGETRVFTATFTNFDMGVPQSVGLVPPI